MDLRRFVFGAFCSIAAIAAFSMSGSTTIQEAGAAEVASSAMTPCSCTAWSCDGDVGRSGGVYFCDGEVDVEDLLIVLGDLGKDCLLDTRPIGDANNDGVVDSGDIDTVNENWGSCP